MVVGCICFKFVEAFVFPLTPVQALIASESKIEIPGVMGQLLPSLAVVQETFRVLLFLKHTGVSNGHAEVPGPVANLGPAILGRGQE